MLQSGSLINHKYLVEQDLYPSKLYYRITRSTVANVNGWGWNFGGDCSVKTDINHVEITSAKAELFSGESDTIKVSWTHNGINNIWSKDSRFVIVRENQTAGTSQEISGLSYNDIEKGIYYDRAVQQCNTYLYNVYVEPGNKSFITEVHSTDAFTPTKMGYLLSANASKGYFSDRVELDWETTGTYDKFSIFRKIHGTPDSNYKVVKTVDGTSVLTTYKDYDDTAEPGKVYDYKIEGSLQCSDSIIQSNPVYAVGFRTPTGDIYGRVTFENGQAEDSVEVYLESDVQAMGKSLFFNGTTASAIVNNFDALNQANEFTIQAWVKHDKQYGSVIRKADMYEIGFTNAGNIYFTVEGNRVETTDSYANVSEFIHITAQKTADALLIYVNGELVKEMQQTISMTANGNDLQFGGSSFVGYIDEVRFWNRALMATEISADYNRYIVGDERGLVAYYSFNYVVDTEFYDLSYLSSTYEYNEKHGKMINVELSEVIPTNAQLGYRAYTNTSGSYTIRAIPYVGSGTAYTIVPKKGIHQFSPQREDRYISNGAQEHTVNFTDVSSFEVTGTVTYEGGTYPVQGVHFLIDGIQVLDNKNQIVTTNANGEFSIQVPVGTHEVRAAKDGHTFLYDGRICDSDLRDLNYQDRVTGREIIDVTRVKYVGRVAGGTIQEAYPVGHGLSKNNLADNITITLTHQRMGYEMSSTEKTEYFKHELSNRNKLNVDSNRVVYGKETATISVNNETGEFVAYLIPEKFNVKVNVQGHTGIPGDNSEINLTQVFANQYAVNEWVDTVAMGSGDVQYKTIQDSVSYNFSQKFIHRVSPEIEIVQIDAITNEISPYFGAKEVVLSDMLGKTDTVAVYSGNQYLFGKPIFEQGNFYKFKISVFEGYRYNGENTIVDRVPTQDASINFTNNLATETNPEALEVDSVSGIAYYTFQVDGPDLATGIKNMSARVTIETDNGSTSSFAWIPTNNFEAGQAYVLGGNPTGTNFVTGGPTKILTVLRDPPGSNSYAYLEKGTSVSTSSTYSGTVSQSGDTGAEFGFAMQQITWVGVGGGTGTKTVDTETSTTITALHEETYTGKETKATSTTFTTRFQTSDSPEYVGADADVYVGSATNLTFGQTNNISLMSKAQYDTLNNGVEEDLKTPLKAESNDGDWVLVQNDGTNIAQSFSTMFAYTQRHVLDVLIPNLQMVRDQYLMQYSDFSESDIEALQAMANAQDTTFYLSYFAPGHPDFGKSNSDATITDKSHGNPDDITNGPSYMIIYNKGLDNKEGVVVYPDTISFMNQSIKGWEKAIYDNEEAKVNANLLQNYSVQAGTNV
ncbi:MAG: LamG-like jellyroll fold domain-containing protein, partial [Paludibacteraceae bacterium]|nr:LamG-like jellyroll fold domain-containing protein [Paludibacteraceae bacterium]